MDLHALFNFPLAETPGRLAPGGLRPAGTKSGGNQMVATGSAFIAPQSLAAFPLASGLVAAFWQAAQALSGVWAQSRWVCFIIALAVALINYVVSITDPKLAASSREKVIGFVFSLINGVYLFITVLGIKVTFAH